MAAFPFVVHGTVNLYPEGYAPPVNTDCDSITNYHVLTKGFEPPLTCS